MRVETKIACFVKIELSIRSLSLSLSLCLSHSCPSSLSALVQNNYTSDPMTKYLRPDVWRYIRRSSVYRQDYFIFSQITATPFNFTVYDVYPAGAP
jgi:hypothetical protein